MNIQVLLLRLVPVSRAHRPVGELTRWGWEGGRRGSDLLTQAGRFFSSEPRFSHTSRIVIDRSKTSVVSGYRFLGDNANRFYGDYTDRIAEEGYSGETQAADCL